ncbi:phasin family protein [Pacificimonas flava]|uniref:Phasin family protein n=1 Tax=Pacificimonas flava TaxID=1234595 RepID=M2U3K0_9SPHN|nr:phasin family protein [Pacificimonas flava]EMD82523.1 phasin family protein [Pacificimonas flava]MBB5281353.1 phasin family protein [Pacificimonas flava]
MADEAPKADPKPVAEKVADDTNRAAANAETAIATVRTAQADKDGPVSASSSATTDTPQKMASQAPAPKRKAAKTAKPDQARSPKKKTAGKPSAGTRKTSKSKVSARKTISAPKSTKPTSMRNSTMATKQNPTETMKAQTETAMNQSKAVFEDVTAKSKEAMEKNAKALEELSGMTRGNVEAMVEAGRIYAEATQAMARDTADFAKKQTEETVETMQALSSVKNPNEVVELQGKYVRGQFDAVVAQTSSMTERALKLSSDMMAPFQNRMATAMEKFTKVA